MRARSILPAVLIAVLTLTAFFVAQAENRGDVVPAPQRLEWQPGTFRITGSLRIVLGAGTTEEDQFAASRINDVLISSGRDRLRVVRESEVRKMPASTIFIGSPDGAYARRIMKDRKIALTPEMKEEGYILEVTADGIAILAESAAGRFYGVMSLLQLLDVQKRGIQAPCARISDWPLMKMRGITDDISRGQVSTVENFKKIIRFLAAHKLNTYSLYIEDMFVFPEFPTIGKDRGALTAEEVRELDRYAKMYHVDLVPIFETLGHWENILSQPEYIGLAEFPGAHTLNVSDERIYGMLDTMIKRMSEAFSSPYFNMAADESWDVGLGANRDRVAASDIATVHAEHYRRLFDILKKYHKKPMMYGDVILNNPSILGMIPNDVVIVDWHYGAADKYPSTETLEKAGFPYVVSPAVWNFTGPFPGYVNAMINIRNMVRDGNLHGARGVLASTWNDNGGEELRELNWFGYAWAAECAWQSPASDIAGFAQRFFHEFCGSREAGEAAEEVYALMSDPLNQFNWSELWRHPMLPLKQAPLSPLWRSERLESTIPLAQRMAARAASAAMRNADHWDYVQFVAALNAWYLQKTRTGEWLRGTFAAMKDSTGTPALREEVVRRTTEVADQLEALKTRFAQLWKRTNRAEGLSLLMDRYDRQISYWKEVGASGGAGVFDADPLISSKWIWHPTATPGRRDSLAVRVPRAVFRKNFEVGGQLQSGRLQLIGDSYATVWVNGDSVGTVFARRSLSLSVETKRVGMWDIAGRLHQGTNSIQVEARNYNQFGSAGFNLYAELVDKSGVKTIIESDSTWETRTAVLWATDGSVVTDSAWVGAREGTYPFEVVRPDFSRNRRSWIER